MGNIRFELNRDGVRELLQSPEAAKLCETIALRALQTLGAGYGSDTRTGRHRVRVEISAKSPRAYFHNLKHNAILKAVGGAKL